MKRSFILVTFFWSLSAFAESIHSNCPLALPSSDPNFCESFKSVAMCHCTEALPPGMCQDMATLYNRMIAKFKSLDKACEFQQDTSKQTCMDDWNCYLSGGQDKQGRLCSATGKKCE